MYRKYVFKPTGLMGVGLAIEKPLMPSQFAEFRFESTAHTLNSKTIQGTSRKRYGYANHRTSTGLPLTFGHFKAKEAVITALPTYEYNFWITPTDLCIDATSTDGGHTSDTFDFRTAAYTYSGTEQVDEIDAATKLVVTFEAGATLLTDGIAAGDYFVLDEDLTGYQYGTDSSWRQIASVDSDTQLTLSTAYEKSVASPGAKNATVLKKYTGPGNTGAWDWCVVDDWLIFCNENDYVQRFNFVSNTFAIEESTVGNWKYCTEFANRCVLANEQTSGSINSIGVKWSKENDPTDWTDSTAGSATLQTSASEITGIKKLGSNIVVFTPTSIIFGYRTGVSTSPIAFQDEKVGVGAYAPHSIVYANGTLYFIGQDNFYRLDGTTAIPVGNAIRDEIFDNEARDELKTYKSAHNSADGEIWWFKPHGQFAYVYDYQRDVWNVYYFNADSIYLQSAGMGIKELNDKEPTFFIGVASNDRSTTTKIVNYSSASTGDNSTAINYRYRTATTDFSDQDPEAFGRWKIIHRVRVIYRDLTTSTGLTCYGAADDTSAPNQFGASANTVGTGSGYVDTTDFDETMTGNWWSFIITNNTANKKVQIVGIEVYYSLGGTFFDV